MKRATIYKSAAFVASIGLLAAGPANPARGQGSSAASLTTVLNAYESVVIDGTEHHDEVRVDFDATGYFTVTDSRGISGCPAVDVTTVRCVLGHPEPNISYLSNGGGDSMTISSSVLGIVQGIGGPGPDEFRLEQGSLARAKFRGLNRGADTLVGGAADDVIAGGPGGDRILGRGGNDGIYGGRGSDALVAGGGDDNVSALGGRIDRKIDCGSGIDVAIIDPRQAVPKPRGCETIKLRG